MISRNSFTLVELLVAFAIFVIVIGLVLLSITGLFRTSRTIQTSLAKEQRQRRCALFFSKEVSSLARLENPVSGVSGTAGEVSFVFARENSLVEARYVCNPAAGTLEHYTQDPADFNGITTANQENFLEGLEACGFSYSDGTAWHPAWAAGCADLPKMIRAEFKFKGDSQSREFVAQVPVS